MPSNDYDASDEMANIDNTIATLNRFRSDESGQDIVEYALLGALVGIFSVFVSRWEPSSGQLSYTPNRWLVLAITILVAARIAYVLNGGRTTYGGGGYGPYGPGCADGTGGTGGGVSESGGATGRTSNSATARR